MNTKKIEAALDRMAELKWLADREEATSAHFVEFRELQAELVRAFPATIDRLIDAGLLAVDIDVSDVPLSEIKQHESITGEPYQSYENGSIWLAFHYDGGTLKQPKKRAR